MEILKEIHWVIHSNLVISLAILTVILRGIHLRFHLDSLTLMDLRTVILKRFLKAIPMHLVKDLDSHLEIRSHFHSAIH